MSAADRAAGWLRGRSRIGGQAPPMAEHGRRKPAPLHRS